MISEFKPIFLSSFAHFAANIECQFTYFCSCCGKISDSQSFMQKVTNQSHLCVVALWYIVDRENY